MSRRYVDPARRRARRRVDGPQGDQPADLDPQPIARVMRCPKCRQTISTMRRWRMACPECGHEWEEETVLTLEDKLADVGSSIGEYAVMAFLWAGLIALPLVFGGLIVYLAWSLTGSVLGAVLVILFGFLLLLFYGGVLRSRYDEVERILRWSRPRR
jgi:hypothetical protein